VHTGVLAGDLDARAEVLAQRVDQRAPARRVAQAGASQVTLVLPAVDELAVATC